MSSRREFLATGIGAAALWAANSASAEVPQITGMTLKRASDLIRTKTAPSISVPCGFTASGLPVGLQITDAHWAESTVLALAYAYEQTTEWHTRRPKL